MAYRILARNTSQDALLEGDSPKQPHDIALSLVCVSLNECVKTQLGPVDRSAVTELQDGRYDYAPVLNAGSPLGWGVVSRARLEQLLESGGELELKDLSAQTTSTLCTDTGYVTALQLFQALTKSSTILCYQDLLVFVSEGSNHFKYEGNIFGLVSTADLNRREVRRACYELLVEVESLVADLVAHELPDPWEWLRKLSSDDERARIVGYWQLSLRNNVDLQPHMLLTLSQLLNIAAGSRCLRARMGYESRAKMESALDNRVREFRNRVMHPVRPLISNEDDVSRWAIVLEELQRLLERLSVAPG